MLLDETTKLTDGRLSVSPSPNPGRAKNMPSSTLIRFPPQTHRRPDVCRKALSLVEEVTLASFSYFG